MSYLQQSPALLRGPTKLHRVTRLPDVVLGLATDPLPLGSLCGWGWGDGSATAREDCDPGGFRPLLLCLHDYLDWLNPYKNILETLEESLSVRTAVQELPWEQGLTGLWGLRGQSTPLLGISISPFPLIKGGQKIAYALQLQQQRLGFSFQSKLLGCLIQMLIAEPELVCLLHPPNDQSPAPCYKNPQESQLDILICAVASWETAQRWASGFWRGEGRGSSSPQGSDS